MTNEQKTKAPDHICVEPNYNAFGDPSWGAYLHENVGVAYTRTALSQAAVGAVVRACAEAIDDPDFTQEDVNYVDNGHKWVLLEEAQTAILALIDQPSALDEALAAAKAEGVREGMAAVDQHTFDAAGGQMVINYKDFRMTCERLLPTKQKDEA